MPRMRYNSTLISIGVASLLMLGACQKNTAPTNDIENLPELPSDLAATIDPNTMATKTPPNPAPGKPPNIALLPCCSSTQTMTMQVTYPYTRCATVRPDLLEQVPQLVFAPSGTPSGSASPSPGATPSIRAFKLTSFNSKPLSKGVLCVTSQGPWNATLIEKRDCSPSIAQDTLIINAFGDQILFQWTGGTPNHPPSVQVVSCRDQGTLKANCGQSSCDCSSISCPPEQVCNCALIGW
jgi:hypothetical protein